MERTRSRYHLSFHSTLRLSPSLCVLMLCGFHALMSALWCEDGVRLWHSPNDFLSRRQRWLDSWSWDIWWVINVMTYAITACFEISPAVNGGDDESKSQAFRRRVVGGERERIRVKPITLACLSLCDILDPHSWNLVLWSFSISRQPVKWRGRRFAISSKLKWWQSSFGRLWFELD